MSLLATPALYDPTGKLYEQRIAPILAGYKFDIDAAWIATRPGSLAVQATHAATLASAQTAYDTLHAANLAAQALLSGGALTTRQAADAITEATATAAITAAQTVVTADNTYNTNLAALVAEVYRN